MNIYPMRKSVKGIFLFFLDFFDFFFAALRQLRDRVPAFTDSRVEPENDTIAKSGMTGLFWG